MMTIGSCRAILPAAVVIGTFGSTTFYGSLELYQGYFFLDNHLKKCYLKFKIITSIDGGPPHERFCSPVKIAKIGNQLHPEHGHPGQRARRDVRAGEIPLPPSTCSMRITSSSKTRS